MGENDDLQILIEAALDFAKSMQNISRQLVQLQSQLNDYRLKITAGLDQATTASQIRQDLSKIDKGKPQIHLVGKMDRNATKTEVEKAVKSLKGVEVKLSTALDPLEAGKQLQNSLPDVPNIEASATVKVDGAEQVDELSRKLKDAGNNAAGMASKVYLARTALQLLRRTVKEAVDTVTELDACVTNLSTATGQSREETYQLLEGYNDLAEKLGATTGQIAQAADEWLRQGRSIADTTTLIEDAMVLSKISQLDSANATQYLTSAMKGYEIAVQDVLGVVDKLSAVDLVSATNAGELAEAMSRTAVTANMAGVSMDRLLGYIATVGEVTQKSMSSVGEGFKTIFSRMNDIKANKLQLIDEDGTEETLSDVELTLKNVGIDLRATVNEYNNYGDVLDSLAAKWDTLSEVQQNALVKAFAGTRQGENFRVLMENYSSAAEYMQVAANSAGTALNKFSAYEESIEAKAASFTAAMENLTMDTVDSDLVKDLIDVGTAVVDFIDKIGLLKSALITLGAGGILKGISAISGEFRAAYKDVINLGEAITTLRNVDNLGADTIAKLGSLTAGLNDEQIKLVLTSTKLSTAQMQAILTAGGLTSEEAAQKIATLGLASSQKTATETTVDLSGAMTGLRAKIKAAFAGMSTTGKIISVLSLVTTAVSIGVSIWQSYKQSQEEARQAALDAAKEYEQAAESIGDYKDRVLELKKSLDEGNLSQEEAYNARKELLSIQDEIREAYGKEAEAINLVGDSAESSADKLDSLARALANEKLTGQASQIETAVKEMEKVRDTNLTIGWVNDAPDVMKAIEEAVSKYKNASVEYPTELADGNKWAVIHISANATEAQEVINGLAADFRDIKKQFEDEGIDIDKVFPSDNTFAGRFESAITDIDAIIEKWGEIYESQVQWKIITDDNYADAMDKINGAGEALQEALASGDNEALAAGIATISALMLDPEKIDDNGVRNYMQGLTEKMQAEALKYTVQVKLSADVDDDEWTSKVKAAIERLSGGDGSTTATEIRDAGITARIESEAAGSTHGYLSDEAQAYMELEAALDEYGYALEDAIPLLEEYGFVSKDVTEKSEETEKALSNLGENISKLKELVDPLKTAMVEMISGGGLSSGTAQSIIEKLTEAGLDYVDYLYEENGALKLNIAAWTDYIKTVNSLDTEGLSEKQAAVLRELYNTLTEEMTGELRSQVVDCFLDIVDAAHDAVDEIQNVSSVLHTAADEFAAYDGNLSIDTLQSILKLEPQYLQLLKDENGVWEINEERVNAVIAAKSRQLAVENAMSYVQRLKVAAGAEEIDKLNELIFVSDSATSSTWGLVYAELELMRVMGELDDSQYMAALHNIEAMEDLAENAISHIGDETGSVAKNMESMRAQLEKTKDGLQDTLDKLEDMQDGAGDLVDYVMDMLKHRIEQQIDLLEEMKDKYSDIIDLKKESLDASKDEQDHQKEISKKIKEMAKLQERLNALSLDDSRSAQTERASLMEQMAELQEDLNDTQADKAVEAQKGALDRMAEDYNAEKDKEIKALEKSISSTQKLYNMAISYIRDNWNTLYQELIVWNTEYGSDLNSEITSAWDAACMAAEHYGDFVSAVMGGISSEIDSITDQIKALDNQISNLSTSSSSGGTGSSGGTSKNTTVGEKSTSTQSTHQYNENMVKAIVRRMKDLGAQWSGRNNNGTNDSLHQQAARLASQLDQYGVHAEFRQDGTWWITRDDLNPRNVGKLLHSCYHTGGFVGDEPLKPNERYIKAENGELMMTADQQESLAKQIERIEALTAAFSRSHATLPASTENLRLGGVGSSWNKSLNYITNNSRPVQITIGDTIIQGNASDKTVQKHIRVTRDMMNQIGNLLRRGG